MEKIDRRQAVSDGSKAINITLEEQTERIWDKLDEIVDWINDRRELRCRECGLSTPEWKLRGNYMNCPDCGYKMK